MLFNATLLNKTNFMRYVFLFMLLPCMWSCTKDRNKLGLVDAYVPVYMNTGDVKTISQVSPQPITNGGKIATIGNFLFQVESNEGIHVIDISNPALPRKISFLKIPFCNEVTLRGNYLYSNNVSDLIALNISNINNISVSSRIPNAFPAIQTQYPPQTGVYFECADNNKGMVFKWELKKVNNPNCRR